MRAEECAPGYKYCGCSNEEEETIGQKSPEDKTGSGLLSRIGFSWYWKW